LVEIWWRQQKVLAQRRFEIPSAVKDTKDGDGCIIHSEGDRHPASEPDRSQSRTNVVAFRSAPGKVGQSFTIIDDRGGEAGGDRRRSPFGNITVKLDQLVIGF